MPVAFRQDGFRFHFYSDEGDPREPVHVHIRRGRDNAKFWLWPEVQLVYNRGFSRAEQRRIALIVEARRDEIERAWNDFSPEPLAVRFDEDSFWVDLDDGRTLGIPLAWFPRLLHGTTEQREKVELSRDGLHWEELDEDISIAGLIAGRGDQTSARKAAA